MRVIRAQLGPAILHDVRKLTGHAIYHPDDYRQDSNSAMHCGILTASAFTTKV